MRSRHKGMNHVADITQKKTVFGDVIRTEKLEHNVTTGMVN